MIRAFVAGAVTGGLLVAIFNRRAREFVDARTRAVRLRAAETIGRAAERLETAKDVIEQGLAGTDPIHGRDRES